MVSETKPTPFEGYEGAQTFECFNEQTTSSSSSSDWTFLSYFLSSSSNGGNGAGEGEELTKIPCPDPSARPEIIDFKTLCAGDHDGCTGIGDMGGSLGGDVASENKLRAAISIAQTAKEKDRVEMEILAGAKAQYEKEEANRLAKEEAKRKKKAIEEQKLAALDKKLLKLHKANLAQNMRVSFPDQKKKKNDPGIA